MRPNSAAFYAQTARGAAFACDTHIPAPHARTIASHPTNVHRGMRNASRSTAYIQEALQATNICTRERLQEPTIHRHARQGSTSSYQLINCVLGTIRRKSIWNPLMSAAEPSTSVIEGYRRLSMDVASLRKPPNTLTHTTNIVTSLTCAIPDP